MQEVTEPLPGLKLLLDALESHGISASLDPPVPFAFRAGEVVLGKPFDPILAKLYAFCDGGKIGDLRLFGMSTPEGGLAKFNESLRHREGPRLQALFRYASVDSLPQYLATVPSLAGADGAQPVVLLSTFDEQVIEPIASNADRALGIYARLVEATLQTTGSLDEPAGIDFPRRFIELIGQDRALVQMVKKGLFDELVSTQRDSRTWVEELLAHTRSS